MDSSHHDLNLDTTIYYADIDARLKELERWPAHTRRLILLKGKIIVFSEILSH